MAKQFIGGLVGLSLLVGIGLLGWAVSNNKIVIGYNLNYQPDQPIPFSHEIHAGQNKIDCKYCHTNVTHSRHSTVPSLNVCMNCHKGGMVTKDTEWIQKLRESYMDKKPVKWEKVHLLPDHVKFNHAAHIKAGKDCTTCHGAVEKMSVVKQKASLSMGWCVNCHREPENKAPLNCSTCHY